MELTDEQRAVISFITEKESNLVVNAFAGSAKTTTSVLAVRETDPGLNVVCVAFNKGIQRTLEKEMPKHAKCKTFNALGFAGVFSLQRKGVMAKNVKVELRPNKVLEIVKSMDLQYGEFPGLIRAVGLAKNCGLVPQGAPGGRGGLIPDTPENWADMLETYNIDTGWCMDPVGACREALLRSIMLQWQGVIDFNDQLYMPAIWRGDLPNAGLVLVDEAQDVSPIQHRLIDLMVNGKGRLAAVGDPFQSIYAFRGADTQAMPRLTEKYSAETLPLSISFRCPSSVVEEAQHYVPGIQPWSGATKGEVKSLTNFSAADLPAGCVVLCRNNAPLVALCMRLIADGRGATIYGRDIGKALANLVKKLKPSGLSDLKGKLDEYTAKEADRCLKFDNRTGAAYARDRQAAINALINQVRDIPSLLQLFNRLFSDDENPPILLSSGHKAKGREWDHVYILDKHLMPSKYAETDEEKQQESNIAYVVITRAKHTLTYITSEGYK